MMWEKIVALVTGGAKGLGKMLTLHILRLGGRVVAVDTDQDAGDQLEKYVLENHGENRFKFMQCDVSCPKEFHHVLEDTKNHFGHLNIICNNAAISHSRELATKVVSVNLAAVIEGTYKGIELMSKKNGGDGGVIINIASMAGTNIFKGIAVYTATKHGVVAFSRSFELESNAEEDGVRVNCICPAMLDTDMLRENIEKMPELKKLIAQDGLARIEDVEKAFERCVEDEKLNGAVFAVVPPDRVYQLEFLLPIEKV